MNEFDDLFVEKEQLNKDILKNLLLNRIKLTETGDIMYEKDYEPTISIMLYLMANKVFMAKNIKENEAEGPREIHLKTGVPEGTVKRYVRELAKKNLLVSSKGKYYIPNHALQKIKTMFDQNDGRN